MALLPKVKLKAMPNFPSKIIDGAGVDVTKINGAFKLDLAFDDFAPPVSGLSDTAHQNVLVWNNVTNTYALVPISLVGGDGGGGGSSGGGGLIISDSPPPLPTDGTLWWESDTGTLYVRYNDGVGPAQWVQAVAVPASVGVAPPVDAAPFDAMSYSGMQINGSMEVSQELGTTGTVISNANVCDCWRLYWGGTMTLAGFQGATSFTPGFSYQLFMVPTVAQPSLAAGDAAFFHQAIEGWRIARLAWGTANARPITIAFWSWHNRIGIHSVAVRNSASNRSYVATYNHTVSGAAQYNVITVPGDTTGTWSTNNTIGIVISFALAAGATLTAPSANTWYGANYVAATGQVNSVAATTDVVRITGVVVLPGTQAPTAAQSPLLMRPYDQELLICKRYYQKSYNADVNPGTATASGPVIRSVTSVAANLSYGGVNFQTPMRANPAVTVYGYAGGATRVSDNNGADLVANSGLASLIGTTGFNPYNGSGVTANPTGQAVLFHYAADARL